MEDRIEISGESVLAKAVEAIFVLGALSLVLYVIATKCKPFAGRILSQLIYWTFIAVLSAVWLIIANGVLKTR